MWTLSGSPGAENEPKNEKSEPQMKWKDGGASITPKGNVFIVVVLFDF